MVRVCIADDDPGSRDVAADILRLEGYDVETVHDGDALLARVQAAVEPLVVLFDRGTVSLNGAAFLAALAADPSLTVRHRFVLVTSAPWGLPPEIDLLLLQTGVPVIEKPFDLPMLLAAVGEATRVLAQVGV